MATYLFAYDLHKQRNYPRLHEGIAKTNAVRVTESNWLISTTSTATQVRDWLKSLVDADDSVAVIEIRGDWAAYNVPKVAIDWLASHL